MSRFVMEEISGEILKSLLNIIVGFVPPTTADLSRKKHASARSCREKGRHKMDTCAYAQCYRKVYYKTFMHMR